LPNSGLFHGSIPHVCKHSRDEARARVNIDSDKSEKANDSARHKTMVGDEALEKLSILASGLTPGSVPYHDTCQEL